MTLPASFDTAEDFFEKSLLFFNEYQHLYNFHNTKLLSKDYLESIDIQGLEDLQIPGDHVHLSQIASNNVFLSELHDKLRELTVDFGDFKDKCLENIIDAPLGLKKKHEIAYLANELEDLCEEIECKTVVDFGAGLGYLDQLLFERSNFNVLGLECSEHNYNAAKKRQQKYHEKSTDKVKYVHHTINIDSDITIRERLKSMFGSQNGFCITGLHACADLTIDAMELFCKMTDARAIMLMSCCYHKMVFKYVDDRQIFKNFPLSQCLKRLCEKHDGFDYLKVPFLRLAAQPTTSLEDLQDLVFNLLARCMLQLYADKYNYTLKRRRRKAVRTKRIENDFDSYIIQACEGFQLTCNLESCLNVDMASLTQTNQCKCNLSFDVEELRNYWRAFPQNLTFKAAIFILIQRSMQPVFENFILFDRLVYLNERGFKNCRIKKIVNELISPRCLALLATK